ncbi:MAG: amino acid ABC transporter permease [Nocardioidaceae bacterium]|nr:amino acid ABC transporter permease [Nocardioidaceae bacterium]NUS52038.1 amino acid ABC transporter permease [Nocardioidaceae bacterium]
MTDGGGPHVDWLADGYGLVLRAFLLTIELGVVAGVFSMLLGVLLAAARVGPVAVLAKAAATYVLVFRNTPLLMVFVFVFVALPKVDIPQLSFFAKGVLALTLYTSAFVCEAVRSGVNSVPLGQAEAARAVGLTFGQTMQEVVLPQAMRAALPPLASVLIALMKNTSVAAAFGLIEATARMRFFTNDNADVRTVIFLVFAIGYVVIVELMSAGAFTLERRWRVAR